MTATTASTASSARLNVPFSPASAVSASEAAAARAERRRRYGYVLRSWPLLSVHLFPLGALFFEVGWQAWAACAAWYAVTMFAITGGYHRYFAHRSFSTSRVFQFILAFLAEAAAQRGVLWWSANHRDHHRHSDQPGDLHSPVVEGFFYAHIGWIFDRPYSLDLNKVRDLAKFPELVWLDRFWLLPPALVGLAFLIFLGPAGLFIGFGLGTVLQWHAAFTINSLAHLWGTRPYPTSDQSRNNALLAVLTFGEGWHNNHHHDMLSARQGFRWWQIDITYYILRALAAVGLVWDLRQPRTR